MKVKRNIVIAMSIFAIVCIAAVHLFFPSEISEAEKFNRLFGTDISEEVKVEEVTDTHGGFHNDGERYCKFTMTQEEAAVFYKSVKQSGQWKSAPFARDIELVMFGNEIDGQPYCTFL